jgi:hypothetical protein
LKLPLVLTLRTQNECRPTNADERLEMSFVTGTHDLLIFGLARETVLDDEPFEDFNVKSEDEIKVDSEEWLLGAS